MSVGDWTCRIWNEDLRSPLLVGPYSLSYLTAGTWSPSRPGVFFTSQSDGSLSCWDLFYKHEPTLRVRSTASAHRSLLLTPHAAAVPWHTAVFD
jgi:dynein intermediate chain 2